MSAAVDKRNAEASRQEVAAFLADVPERYFAYRDYPRDDTANFRTITTWTGDKLADVISRGDVYRSNFGDLRRAFRARAINGATYSGIAYLDSGDYVRMRKVKR